MDTTIPSPKGSTGSEAARTLSGSPGILRDSVAVEGQCSADTASAVAVASRDAGDTSRRSRLIARTPSIHRTPAKLRDFIALARWEGAVAERYATYFAAELIDLDTGEHASAEFELSKVKPGDLRLCEPGALFYWSVGYEVKQGGQRVRVSDLRFRRIGTAANRV